MMDKSFSGFRQRYGDWFHILFILVGLFAIVVSMGTGRVEVIAWWAGVLLHVSVEYGHSDDYGKQLGYKQTMSDIVVQAVSWVVMGVSGVAVWIMEPGAQLRLIVLLFLATSIPFVWVHLRMQRRRWTELLTAQDNLNYVWKLCYYGNIQHFVEDGDVLLDHDNKSYSFANYAAQDGYLSGYVLVREREDYNDTFFRLPVSYFGLAWMQLSKAEVEYANKRRAKKGQVD